MGGIYDLSGCEAVGVEVRSVECEASIAESLAMTVRVLV